MEDESQHKCIDTEVGQLIFLYELKQLRDQQNRQFEEHLMRCNYCMQQVQDKLPIFDAFHQNKEEIRADLEAEGLLFQPSYSLLDAIRSGARRWMELLSNILDWLQNVIQVFSQPKVLVPIGAIAAALFIIVLIQPKPGDENPYLPYLSFQKIPYRQMQTRGTVGEEAQQLFTDGMTAYREDKFTLAADHVTKAVELAPGEGLWWLYLGVIHYLDHQPELAIIALAKANSLTEYALKSTSRWYLAQSYLLNEDSESGVHYLKILADQQREYAEEAQRLLNEIESAAEQTDNE